MFLQVPFSIDLEVEVFLDILVEDVSVWICVLVCFFGCETTGLSCLKKQKQTISCFPVVPITFIMNIPKMLLQICR